MFHKSSNESNKFLVVRTGITFPLRGPKPSPLAIRLRFLVRRVFSIDGPDRPAALIC